MGKSLGTTVLDNFINFYLFINKTNFLLLINYKLNKSIKIH